MMEKAEAKVLKNGEISFSFDVERILGSKKVLVYCSTGRIILCRCNKEVEQTCFSLKNRRVLFSIKVVEAAGLEPGMKTKKIICYKNCIELIFENYSEEEPFLVPRALGVSVLRHRIRGRSFTKFKVAFRSFVYEILGKPKRVEIFANKGILLIKKTIRLGCPSVVFNICNNAYEVALCSEAVRLTDVEKARVEQVYFERDAIVIILSNYEGSTELFRVC